MELNAIKTPNLYKIQGLDKKEEIRAYFHNTYTLYERLFETISDENGFYLKPDALRHPLIFYYGHTAVFFINKLYLAGLVNTRINEAFESMLAIGVDEMAWDDLDDNHYNWPKLSEVKHYRTQVRDTVDKLIDEIDFVVPITWDSPPWVLLMGIEHERIHLETSSVLIRQLPLKFVRKHPEWPDCSETGAHPGNQLLPVEGGKVTLGKPKSHQLYGWDNEYGFKEETVTGFNASQFLVSNGEYLAFIVADGYNNSKFWSDEGWLWRNYLKSDMPRFWRKKEGRYFLRTMTQEIDMPWSWPCEVNYHEAKAFCNWMSRVSGKSIRLPTEAEWYCLRETVSGDFDTWTKAPGNIDLNYCCSAMPVNAHQFGDFYDLIGNVWQWTESTINGFNGFKVHPLYDDFSTPTFDSQHHLIKGGSFISTGNEATKYARYSFRKHFYQHAGFRYIESDVNVCNEVDVYETDTLVAQYMDFHFGPSHFDVANFPKTVADICLALPGEKRRALDIGCAVGRASFELSRKYNEVVGIDFSARFIQIAAKLKKSGQAKYQIPKEGDLVDYCQIYLNDLIGSEPRGSVKFLQGDACNLPPKYGLFDLVLACNLIDRLSHPAKFLRDIDSFINPNGYLIIVSPYTWLTEFTDKENWLGGFKGKDGENVTTLSGLTNLLDGRYTLMEPPQAVEFVIKETQRKFQHTFSELTIWQKKP